MSSFLQIVGTDLPSVAGLCEQLVWWGGEEVPTDPRRFAFNSIKMLLLPIPLHIRSILPAELADEPAGLQLSDDVVVSWASDRAESGAYADLRRLFEAIAAAGPCAITYEAGSGSGTQTLTCATQHLFDVVDAAVRGRSTYDLTIVVP